MNKCNPSTTPPRIVLSMSVEKKSSHVSPGIISSWLTDFPSCTFALVRNSNEDSESLHCSLHSRKKSWSPREFLVVRLCFPCDGPLEGKPPGKMACILRVSFLEP
mmetsp:Transcript_28340/g.56825  ORF Transcript_28340/g.56825 Transcript_28340/m.56825 type:complete len:105 (+) Transcript_28340:418-732(+)